MLITDLAQSPHLKVFNPDRVFEFSGNGESAGNGTVHEIAVHSGVDILIQGNFVAAGDAVRLNARMVDSATGRIFTAVKRYEGYGPPPGDEHTSNRDPSKIMTILLRNLPLALDQDETDLAQACAEFLNLEPAGIEVRKIVTRSVDARRRRRPRLLYNLAIDVSPETERSLLAEVPPRVEPVRATERVEIGRVRQPVGCRPPVVVGSGPAGLFAAYRLVQAGFQPIVIERGLEVTERTRQWNRFLKGDSFNPESNLLFGEGGAGTYSDGKLYTWVNDPRVGEVLAILADHGAPREILIDAKPHIGSNRLPSVVRRLRNTLRDRGTVFRFSTRMTGLRIEYGRVWGVDVEPGGAVETEHVFLGTGHSARDTIRTLHSLGVAMEPKPFQLGARIEHPQHLINRMQYGIYRCIHY